MNILKKILGKNFDKDNINRTKFLNQHSWDRLRIEYKI